MGKLHHILTPAELAKLAKSQKAELQKKFDELKENDPMLKELIKRQQVVHKHIRQKLKI
jgi:hypothetical protein